MKITLLCKRLVTGNMGGVERVVIELAKEFTRQGHEVTILSRKEHKNELNEEEIGGILIKRITTINISGLRTISSLFKMIKLIKNTPTDIYNSHDWSPTIPFLIKNFKAPYVMTSHGFYADYDNPNKIIKFMERFVLSKAKKPVICVQKRSSTDYLKRFEFVYIPNGVNTNYFRYSKKSERYALFVGSVDERKNVERACKAFYNLKKEGIDIPFKVVGEGPLKDRLIKEYPFIEFSGHKEGPELVKLYQNCKFFILPSNAEGFGLVWLEAMSCGKPVIASSVGVGPDIIKSDMFGRVVKDPKSLKEITRAIKELNLQIDNKNFDTKKIRDFVIENYSWAAIARKYLKVYKLGIKK